MSFARRRSASERPRFPPELAFVVQFSGATRRDSPVQGRVEHVVSGRSARFRDGDELVAFMRGALPGETSS